ncbi:hypothetical protein VNO77_06000 [Canavalia gladiata]|uniref:Uncharacterized protein n=1 Tax=Canavalia gladiata TaxID=3824 RepID=A0AAN9N041_CANGL
MSQRPILQLWGWWSLFGGLGLDIIVRAKRTRAIGKKDDPGRSSCFDQTIVYDKDKHTNILLSLLYLSALLGMLLNAIGMCLFKSMSTHAVKFVNTGLLF